MGATHQVLEIGETPMLTCHCTLLIYLLGSRGNSTDLRKLVSFHFNACVSKLSICINTLCSYSYLCQNLLFATIHIICVRDSCTYYAQKYKCKNYTLDKIC